MRCLHRLALAVAAVSLAGLVLASPVEGATGADWPQARASAAHRGWNKNETTITTSKVAKLQPRWSAGAATDAEGAPVEPIVAGGRLVTFNVTGSYDTWQTTITARDAVSGAVRWTRTLAGGMHVTPAVSGGRLYVVTTVELVVGGLGAGNEYRLFALHPATGATVWMRSQAGFEQQVDAMAVDGNRVALVHWFDAGYYRAWLWSTEGVLKATWTSGEYDFWAGNGPTMANGIVYLLAANEQGGFTEAYTSAGKPVSGWASTQMSQAPQLPAAASDLVYWADKHAVVVTNPSTGKVKVRMLPTAAEDHFRDRLAPAVDGQRLYLVYRSAVTNVPTLTAFDRWTGKRLWSTTIGAVVAPPTVANSVVYVAEGRRGVAAYAATNGTQLWRAPGVANSSPPVVANGRLYVGWRAGSDTSTPAPVTVFVV